MNPHELAKAGSVKGLKSLLALKKNCHKFIDKDNGWNPLHYAAAHSKVKAVELLLEAGANPNSTSQKNKYSPMDVADGPKRKLVIKALRDSGGRFANMTLHGAVEEGDMDIIGEYLEDESININERDRRGWMPIHYAVDYDNLEIVKLLIEHGGNINGGTLDGLNPCEIAKDAENENLLEYLKSKGGQLNVYRGQKKELKREKWVGGNQKQTKYDPDAMFPKRGSGKKGLLEAVADKLSGEEGRERANERRKALEAQQKAKQEKAAEEERIKRAPRIKWKWGEDPFKCKGGGLVYDRPCPGYVFFMDIVKYSAKSTTEQKRVIDELSDMVKATKQFKSANRAGKLVALPTGDGMVLGFFTSVTDSFLCALEVAKKVFKHPSIGLRMGVHYGPCVPIKDINNNPNISGDGINMAQRVMDAGDNDHLLVSNAVHGHISGMGGMQFEDYGQVYVKHGVAMHLWTVFGNNFGRQEFPSWRVEKA